MSAYTFHRRAGAMLLAGVSLIVAVFGVLPQGSTAATAAAPGAGETQMISWSDTTPAVAADDNAYDPSVSADGRFVVFTSAAMNLGSIRPTARHEQVYLRDVAAGTTRAVSAAGGVLGDGDSDRGVISADGQFVAFISTATNLVSSARGGAAQVLLWSRATGSISHVSISNDAVPGAANGRATGVSVSADGTRVAFSSNATNLTGDATRGVFQVYVRDIAAGTTTLASVDRRGPRSGADADVVYPTISGDGRVVAFATSATLTDIDARAKGQIYAVDLAASTTELISVNAAGTGAAFGESFDPALSRDGRMVGFVSNAPDLTRFSSVREQVYLRNRAQGSTELVSIDAAASARGNGGSFSPSLSGDGSVVAFQSTSTNLVPETGESKPELLGRLFIRDMRLQRTVSGCRSSVPPTPCDGWSGTPSLSSDGHTVAFASEATNIVPGASRGRPYQLYVRDLTPTPSVERISGLDRYEVSASTSRSAFSTGVPVAYVASGATFPDALSGSAAAGAQRGPVLLVTKDTIPTVVGIELIRLKPQRIVVLGGANSVSAAVEAGLAAYTPVVTRIAGADRYVVSAAISQSVFGQVGGPGGEHPRVFIASGEVFPDALSGSAFAGASGNPVLLVRRDDIPTPVLEELKRLAPSSIVVLGGVNTVSEGVVGALRAIGPTSRIDGPDRYAVSASVSERAFPSGASVVYVASGAVFPDALSGSAAAVQDRGPVLLVTADGTPPRVADELDRLNPTRIVVLGGPLTVSDAVVEAMKAYLEPS